MFASLVSVRNTLDLVARDFDADSLSPVESLRVVDELASIRRLVDGMLAKTAKQLAETNTSSSNGAAEVARRLGVRPGEVRAAIETATRLEDLPATDGAVREGRLSAGEAHMIAEAAIVNPDAEATLLKAAERGLVPLKDACIAARAAVEDPAERAQRQHRQRQWRMWTDAEGMLAGRFRFTPETGGALKAAIETHVQRIFRARKAGAEHEPNDAYAADAVAAFVLGNTLRRERRKTENASPPPDPPAPRPGVDATVHVVVDHGALMRGGTADGEVCEIPGVGPVDVAWVQELLGSAFVTAVIKKGKDLLTVAHLGRHVPAELMTALVVSGRECDVESCSHRGYLERDHVQDFARGGPTSLTNLGWLCYRHHRLKSGGWQLGPPDPDTRKRTLRPPTAQVA
jgi:Domain of unknown function (DUF222)